MRAFRQARDGRYYLQWFDENHRKRSKLLKGVRTAREAKASADELAAVLAKASLGVPVHAEPQPTLAGMLDRYLKEVTPRRAVKTRQYQVGAARMWVAFLDCQPEAWRHSSRLPDSLDRIDWDRFIDSRRNGLIPGWPRRVRERTVEYDLRFLIAVLNCGVGARMLLSNPWGTEIRRAQRWAMPREKNPFRPSMTHELREGLITHSTGWQFAAMLRLQRETVRRNSAIRRLRWSDIDLRARTIRWRADADKTGRENVTPLTDRAVAILRGIPRGIGDAPVFPAKKDPTRHTSAQTCGMWMRRAKARWLASVPDAKAREDLRQRLWWVGWHSEKRAGVRDPDFRALPAAVQEELTGTNFETLRKVYDEVTLEEIRAHIRRASGGAN